MLARRVLSRGFATASASATLASAAVLQRLPVVTRDRSSADEEFQQLAAQIDRSHRRVWPEDKNTRKQAAGADDDAGESIQLLGAEAEASGEYVPAPRVTEADRTNDRRSLDRQLAKRLYLIVKKPDQEEWQFPWIAHAKGERCLADTAARGLADSCGPGVSVMWPSRAPSGHLATAAGTLFFHTATHLGGEVQLNKQRYADFAWVARSELPEYFRDQATLRLLTDMLWD